MTKRRISLVLAFTAALAACSNSNDNSFQGWVEADLIFVSPDESGRVETLSVREGDAVAQGAPLFTVDAELQQADAAVAQASVTNARQAFDRAQTWSKLRPARSGPSKKRKPRYAPPRHDSIPHRRGWRAARYRARWLARFSRFTTGPAKWCRPGGRCSRCCLRATSRYGFLSLSRICKEYRSARRSRSTAMAAAAI
jgi:hypothetical protein